MRRTLVVTHSRRRSARLEALMIGVFGLLAVAIVLPFRG